MSTGSLRRPFGYKHLVRSLFMMGLFVIAASGTVFYALGYKYNWATRSIQQTGIIEMDSHVSNLEADIYVNDKLVKHAFPFRYSYLFPGQYSVAVKKEGYQTWSSLVSVQPNQVSHFRHIILVKENPPILTSHAGEKAGIGNRAFATEVEGRVNELWINKKFITRTSDDIHAADWYPGRQHVVFQAGRIVYLYEIEGQRTFRITEFETELPAKWEYKDGGRVISFLQNGELKSVELYSY